MAIKSTYQIQVIAPGSASTRFWQLTNLITGNNHIYPVLETNVNTQIQSTTDYNFIFNRNELDQLHINILDIKYIGSSGTPAYNNVATDLASILALL